MNFTILYQIVVILPKAKGFIFTYVQLEIQEATSFYYKPHIVSSRIVHFIRSIFFQQKRSSASTLFSEALKNENNGEYAAALATYQAALAEINKSKYPGDLKNKIIDKIKVINMVIHYEQKSQSHGIR